MTRTLTRHRTAGLVAFLAAVLLALNALLITTPAVADTTISLHDPHKGLLATEAGSGTCPDGFSDDVDVWHFVAPANADFTSLTVSFDDDGSTITRTLGDAVRHPDDSHAYVSTPVGARLLDGTATITTSDSPGHSEGPDKFVLSHACPGTDGGDDDDDVRLVKVWQNANGAPASAPTDIDWTAILTTDGDGDTITLDQDNQPTDTTTTDDATYQVTEDDTSADFDEVACSAATQTRVDNAFADADTINYDGSGTGFAIDGDTVHVICNTVTDTPPPPPSPDTWDLTVQKDVEGETAPRTYAFQVDCDGEAHDTTLTLVDGESETIEDLPEDVDCTVTETGTGDADATYAGNSEGPTEETTAVTVDEESPNAYFINEYTEDDTDVLPAIVEPTATVAGSCDGVEVELDNTESTESVTFTVTINGNEQEITVPAGAADAVSEAIDNNEVWSASVAVGDNVLASDEDSQVCTEVKGEVIEKPAPKPAAQPQDEEPEVLGVAQERLPRTGLGSGELFMLALLLLALGTTALMAPRTRREH